MKEHPRKELNRLLQNLFNAVTEDDFLQIKPSGAYMGTQKLSPSTINSYIEQASTILQMELWSVIVKQMQLAANKRMYVESTSDDDLIFGKAMLYALDVLQKKLYNLSNINKK